MVQLNIILIFKKFVDYLGEKEGRKEKDIHTNTSCTSYTVHETTMQID